MEKKKRSSIFRLICGLYLGYLSYSLLFGNDKEALQEYPGLILAGILFMLAAVFIVAVSWKQYKAIKAEMEAEAKEAQAAAEEADRQRLERNAQACMEVSCEQESVDALNAGEEEPRAMSTEKLPEHTDGESSNA